MMDLFRRLSALLSPPFQQYFSIFEMQSMCHTYTVLNESDEMHVLAAKNTVIAVERMEKTHEKILHNCNYFVLPRLHNFHSGQTFLTSLNDAPVVYQDAS